MNSLRGKVRNIDKIQSGFSCNPKCRRMAVILLQKFRHLEVRYGTKKAVMMLWRAGKRSGYDKAYSRRIK